MRHSGDISKVTVGKIAPSDSSMGQLRVTALTRQIKRKPLVKHSLLISRALQKVSSITIERLRITHWSLIPVLI